MDRRGGWQLRVEDGVTGWLCGDDREFVYKASRCAFETEERNQMRVSARARLEQHWGLGAAGDSWEGVFKEIARAELKGMCHVRAQLDISRCSFGRFWFFLVIKTVKIKARPKDFV